MPALLVGRPAEAIAAGRVEENLAPVAQIRLLRAGIRATVGPMGWLALAAVAAAPLVVLEVTVESAVEEEFRARSAVRGASWAKVVAAVRVARPVAMGGPLVPVETVVKRERKQSS